MATGDAKGAGEAGRQDSEEETHDESHRSVLISMVKSASLLSSVIVFAGCAATTTFEPSIPPGYVGPTATIADHGFSEGSRTQIFYVESIDGRAVRSTAYATRRATEGRGLSLVTDFQSHPVPARQMRLKLVGSHITAAPIQELLDRGSGNFHRVEHEVIFTPEPGREYFVKGLLAAQGAWLCIADAKTEQCVSQAGGKQSP